MYKNALRILFSTEEVTTVEYLSKVNMASEMQCLFSDVNISPWILL